MPGMSGPDAYLEMSAIRPGLELSLHRIHSRSSISDSPSREGSSVLQNHIAQRVLVKPFECTQEQALDSFALDRNSLEIRSLEGLACRIHLQGSEHPSETNLPA